MAGRPGRRFLSGKEAASSLLLNPPLPVSVITSVDTVIDRSVGGNVEVSSDELERSLRSVSLVTMNTGSLATVTPRFAGASSIADVVGSSGGGLSGGEFCRTVPADLSSSKQLVEISLVFKCTRSETYLRPNELANCSASAEPELARAQRRHRKLVTEVLVGFRQFQIKQIPMLDIT